jgi:hypothetical protein
MGCPISRRAVASHRTHALPGEVALKQDWPFSDGANSSDAVAPRG